MFKKYTHSSNWLVAVSKNYISHHKVYLKMTFQENYVYDKWQFVSCT